MILRAENAGKRYFRKTGQANFFYAVEPVSLTLDPGTVTVLVGRSESGKTTLLHLLAGLLTPSEGTIYWDDIDIYSLADAALSRLRNERAGVVPQGRSAIATLTVRENILLPSQLYGRAAPREAAQRWMEALGIAALADARPAALSGGELRRMAIARVLAQDTALILADEPTGDLDDENTRLVLDAFRQAAADGKTVFLVTHEHEALSCADRAYRMDGGRLSALQL